MTAFELRLDVAANAENALCERFFTFEDNALEQEWDAPFWCNPPYSDIEPWVDKALISKQLGLMLLPARASAIWYLKLTDDPHVMISPFDGRINFDPPPGVKVEKNKPLENSLLFLIDKREGVLPFSAYGAVYSKHCINRFTGELIPFEGRYASRRGRKRKARSA